MDKSSGRANSIPKGGDKKVCFSRKIYQLFKCHQIDDSYIEFTLEQIYRVIISELQPIFIPKGSGLGLA